MKIPTNGRVTPLDEAWNRINSLRCPAESHGFARGYLAALNDALDIVAALGGKHPLLRQLSDEPTP